MAALVPDPMPDGFDLLSTAEVFTLSDFRFQASVDAIAGATDEAARAQASSVAIWENEMIIPGPLDAAAARVTFEVSLTGSLSSPQGFAQLQFKWDFSDDLENPLDLFGDGLRTVYGEVGAVPIIQEIREVTIFAPYNEPFLLQSELRAHANDANGEIGTVQSTLAAEVTGFRVVDFVTGEVILEQMDETDENVFRWINKGGGSFHEPEYWDMLSAPQDETHTAVFNVAGLYTVLFTDDAKTGTTQVLDGDVSFVLNGHTYTAQNGAESGLIVDGRLTVGGGPVNARSVQIGRFSGGNGRLTVTGGFSGVPTVLTAEEGIQVGMDSPGDLRVEDGTKVVAPSIAIGFDTAGQATVSGVTQSVPSRLESTAGVLTVGKNGNQSSLTVSDGGSVTVADRAQVKAGSVVNVRGGAGGTASVLTVNTGFLDVGSGGSEDPNPIENPPTAVLNITDGAQVSVLQSQLRLGAFGPGIVTVGGVRGNQPSMLTAKGLAVGFFDLGTLTVSGGGVVRSEGDAFIGTGAHAEAVVDGVNGPFASTLEITSGDLSVGAVSTLTVANGGVVVAPRMLTVRDGSTLDYRSGKVLVGQGQPSANGSLLIGSEGILEGTGTLIGGEPGVAGTGVNNFAGRVRPGTSPGILTIEGNYTQGAAGTLELEVGGMNVGGESDQLLVTGDAMIDGTVVFKFIDGFAPTAGQEFGALLAVDGAVNVGEASFVVQNLANGFEYDVTPMDSGFMLTALTDGTFQQAVPGDYNNSGQVEQADLDLVLLNWGNAAMPIPAGWINDLPAGLIDQAELDGVLLNWGNALAGATSVPEPSTAALLALALVAAATSFGVRHAK